jgi:hypothetical protein
MTTLYLFHPWIEASETGDTVLSLFGQWWDGDVAPAGGAFSIFDSPIITAAA